MYVEIVELVLGLLVVVIALVTVARRFAIPYPILLVLGGLVLGFVPHLPNIILNPDLVFLLFLPPLLYWESLNTPLREFRANMGSILLLAIGLVLVTTTAVAVIAHMLIGLSWPVAFVLGAIISPTDTVAAAAIAQRLSLPRRVVAVLEGESLLNDATALVAYSTAAGVVASGSFFWAQAGIQFVVASGGGVIIGLIVGLIVIWVRRALHDPPVENTISLLTGFAAYLPAQALGLSGVLAVVAVGLYLERQGPSIVSPQTRLQAIQLWQVVVFLLNGLLFILVGLQLNTILASHALPPVGMLLLYAALISLTIIVIRIIWVFSTAYLPRFLSRRLRERDPYPAWQDVAIVAWTGMRGGVSLAAALALGISFPQRDLIVFLTFSVILATLVVQGLSLPPFIQRLKVTDDGVLEREEAKARLKTVQAAMARLDELANEDWVPQDVVADLRSHYTEKSRRSKAQFDGSDTIFEERIIAYRRLQQEILSAKRKTIIDLRNHSIINDEVMRKIQHDIDMEETMLSS
ncbi:MAG TPA: Na+/H+ antiporter [Ktedonobacteraceae bacterium]|nr:Na+/H+ antiporter [Ktedonobacteraceae bacterium]